MLTTFQAIILGIVQGLTEFLPVSSTAHLRIVPALLGWQDPGAQYSAIIQLGTVVAVLLYFTKDLWQMFQGVVGDIKARQLASNANSRLLYIVGIGTIPIGILGLLLKKRIETDFRSLYFIAAALVVMAIVSWVLERRSKLNRDVSTVSVKDGIVVGLFQALALIPGASRSGSTLAGAFFCDFKREDAARFSFLLSIPATTLAGLLQLKSLMSSSVAPGAISATAIGTVVSFVVGILAIHGLMLFLKTRSTLVFVIYRIALGGTLFVLLGMGKLTP